MYIYIYYTFDYFFLARCRSDYFGKMSSKRFTTEQAIQYIFDLPSDSEISDLEDDDDPDFLRETLPLYSHRINDVGDEDLDLLEDGEILNDNAGADTEESNENAGIDTEEPNENTGVDTDESN